MDAAVALRRVLRASVLYDLVSLALLLVMPNWLFQLFAHPMNVDPFLFRLAALPLWMCPVVYWMASSRVRSEPTLVRASVSLRMIGAVGIAALTLWHRPEGSGAYWTFVVADGVWAGAIEALRRRL